MRELAAVFLKIGTFGFGGPAAHIAMIREECVERRKWLTEGELLDLLGAVNLIPGPNSTELAIHIGHKRGGWRGLVLAGVCFILPAFLVTLLIAWLYSRFGRLPDVQSALSGIKPVIIAIVLVALKGLAPVAAKSRPLIAITIVCILASLAGVNELLILGGAGFISLLLLSRGSSTLNVFAPVAATTAASPLSSVISLDGIFWSFFKIGSVLYGSGYVLLAFLKSEFVDRLGWLTQSQLLDAIAVGQFTPGPVFTTATFIGFLLAKGPGAIVATIGIFLPAFIFVALSAPLIPRIRSSPAARAFLDGVNAASLSLMAVVTYHLAQASIDGLTTMAILIGSLILTLRLRVNSAYLVLAGGAIGAIFL